MIPPPRPFGWMERGASIHDLELLFTKAFSKGLGLKFSESILTSHADTDTYNAP
jgi:hypothetical protein